MTPTATNASDSTAAGLTFEAVDDLSLYTFGFPDKEIDRPNPMTKTGSLAKVVVYQLLPLLSSFPLSLAFLRKKLIFEAGCCSALRALSLCFPL